MVLAAMRISVVVVALAFSLLGVLFWAIVVYILHRRGNCMNKDA